jgi:uncharacterized protein YbjT (DUF2867 family)
MIATQGKTIVVIGVTGRQGGQVAQNLIRQGWRVRGITRKPEGKKAAALKALGVEVVKADLEDPAALEAAFENAYGVYNMQAHAPGRIEVEIRQGRNAAQAAKRTGVKHLVYGSAGPGHTKTGIEQWDAKREVTQTMKELGLPLTVLRPMAFMELMSDPTYYPNSSTWYIWPKLMGTERKIPWISVQDLGMIAAKAFANPEEYLGRDLPLAADAQSLAECREIYREVYGKSPSRFPMPMFLFEKFVGKDIPNMWRWLRTNPVSLDTNPTLAVYPEVMTIPAWMRSLRDSSQ